MDTASIVYVVAALVLLIALNRQMFSRLGARGTAKWALIWALIFLMAVAAVQTFGVPERWAVQDH